MEYRVSLLRSTITVPVGTGTRYGTCSHSREQSAPDNQKSMVDETSSVGFVGRGGNEYAAFAMTMDQYNKTKGFADDSTRTFPQKLMDILSDGSHAHIISWCDHGNAFMIHKKKVFESEILPLYFRGSRFASFTRKLNRWGFSRVSRGPETGSYYHKLFSRDNPELCTQMSNNSGTKVSYVPSHPQPFANMQGPIGSFGCPTMLMPGPQMTLQSNPIMWQQMQLMQMQHIQMMQMQQVMVKGVQEIPSLDGFSSRNKVSLSESSTNGLDTLFRGSLNDPKASLSDTDEG
ncbi:hypothetical protein FisN_1Lh308 [Fistulifera solaris]|uniref:HSF-type DNA-binding domain-containing protein n=1 Tax=Fistulifera solaris TaxID=1519565 RepID=A0A1Z5K4B8_FISSO|nr:hypothetical protein FisN_1Lh308 [Fistulifera solaris]|eukprot:GAX21022.1 hypothetical protein FisN_1Lh308 [Fistulifera solaris]